MSFCPTRFVTSATGRGREEVHCCIRRKRSHYVLAGLLTRAMQSISILIFGSCTPTVVRAGGFDGKKI